MSGERAIPGQIDGRRGISRGACRWGSGHRRAARGYLDPLPPYEALRGHVAFYAGRVDACVGEEQVAPQDGGFYGGWITRDLAGPFKGGPGTSGW